MSKKSSNDSANNLIEQLIARRGLTMSKLAAGTVVLIETVAGSIITLKMIDPYLNLVEFYSTAEGFRHVAPKRCYFYGAWADRSGNVVAADRIVKGAHLQLKFQDADFLTSEVATARVEGPNWYYDVIE